MTSYPFRLINVFAESRLAGNPLCVFEDARTLDDAAMQALALQFNLWETTFLLPSQVATARVRIFTPTFEMPFAGHPTLGSAHVVRDVASTGDAITLELRAGVIPVSAKADVWTLEAKAPRNRAPLASRADLAAMLGLLERDLAGAGSPTLWIDTGVEQLVIPLATFDAVRRAAPRPDALLAHGHNEQRAMAYVFAREERRVLARFFPPTRFAGGGSGHRVRLRKPRWVVTGDRGGAAAAVIDRPGRGRRPALPIGARSYRRWPHPRLGTGGRIGPRDGDAVKTCHWLQSVTAWARAAVNSAPT